MRLAIFLNLDVNFLLVFTWMKFIGSKWSFLISEISRIASERIIEKRRIFRHHLKFYGSADKYQLIMQVLFVLYDNRAAFNKQQLFFPHFHSQIL